MCEATTLGTPIFVFVLLAISLSSALLYGAISNSVEAPKSALRLTARGKKIYMTLGVLTATTGFSAVIAANYHADLVRQLAQ